MAHSNQGGVKNYLGNQKMVKAPLHWQSAPNHPTTELAYITKKEKDLLIKKDLHRSLKGGVNRGPSGIMSLNGWGSSDDSQNRAGADISAGMDKSGSDAGWSSPGGGGGQYNTAKSPAELSILAGQKGSSTVMPESHYGREYKDQGQGFGFGNLFKGALGIFGGAPGKVMAMLSRLNPQKLRGWNEEEDRYNTQGEWQDARDARINQKRIDSILNRSDKFPITEMTQKNLAKLGYTGEMPSIGSTASLRKGNELGLYTGAVPKANDFITRKNQDIVPLQKPNNFMTNINDPSKMESGMQLSNNQMNSMDNLINMYQNKNKNLNNVSGNDMYSMNADQAAAMAANYGMGTGANQNSLYNYRADGGRIGYNRGRVVNPGGYRGDEEFEEFEDENTLDFMRDQGVPYGEMAETSPFEMRIQELMDEGMSWQEAYKIAAEEFGQVAEGESDQGIASIV